MFAYVTYAYLYLKYSPEAQFQAAPPDIAFMFFIPFVAAEILVVIIWIIAATIHRRKIRKISTKSINI
jgi:hypothetical protein